MTKIRTREFIFLFIAGPILSVIAMLVGYNIGYDDAIWNIPRRYSFPDYDWASIFKLSIDKVPYYIACFLLGVSLSVGIDRLQKYRKNRSHKDD